MLFSHSSFGVKACIWMRFPAMRLPLETSIFGCQKGYRGHCFQLFNIKKAVKIQLLEVAHHAAFLDLNHSERSGRCANCVFESETGHGSGQPASVQTGS